MEAHAGKSLKKKINGICIWKDSACLLQLHASSSLIPKKRNWSIQAKFSPLSWDESLKILGTDHVTVWSVIVTECHNDSALSCENLLCRPCLPCLKHVDITNINDPWFVTRMGISVVQSCSLCVILINTPGYLIKFHNFFWVFFSQAAYLLEVLPSWLMQLTCYQTLPHFLSVFLPSGLLAGCQIRKGHLATTEQVIYLIFLHAHVW